MTATPRSTVDALPRGDVLFLLPHPDDELFVLPRIIFEHRAQARCWCVFTTSGECHGVRAETRANESLRTLRRIGIPDEQIVFVGAAAEVRSSALINNMDRVYDRLQTLVAGRTLGAIYTSAYEGGHPDHDATFFLAQQLAVSAETTCALLEYYCYNGFAAYFMLPYRVMAPIALRLLTRRVSWGDAWRTVSSVRNYRSQARSWLGLFGGLCWQTLILRTERLHPTTLPRPLERPHAGRLFYEGRFHLSYDVFEAAIVTWLGRIANGDPITLGARSNGATHIDTPAHAATKTPRSALNSP